MDTVHEVLNMEMGKRNLTNFSDNDINTNKKLKTHAILEHGCINYISVPTLESIAITKIVVELCRQPNVRNEILQEKFKEVEEKISKKLDLLPNLLKEKALDIIHPIEMQVFDWSKHYLINEDVISSNICRKELEFVCWTMEGTIDKKKTLELLLNNTISQNIHCIYNAACRFCAEDRIVNLWESLQKSCREGLFYSKLIYESYEYHLIAYWTCFARKELHKLLSMIKPSDDANIYDCNHSVNKNMFTLSVMQGNALAAKYFWNKLTEEEISRNIITWTECVINSRKKNIYNKTNEYTEILCFLLSQIKDKEQQMKILLEYSEIILEALFFDWRWRKFLLPTIQVMRDFLECNIYMDLLLTVLYNEIRAGRSMTFVKKLWYDSHEDVKNFFIQNEGVDLCYCFLYLGDFQSVEKIFDLFFDSQDQIDEYLKHYL